MVQSRLSSESQIPAAFGTIVIQHCRQAFVLIYMVSVSLKQLVKSEAPHNYRSTTKQRYVAVSLLLSVVGCLLFLRPSLISGLPTTNKMAPFSLFVTLQFSAKEHKDTFMEDIAPLATYIRNEELQTIAYEVLLSDQDPLKVLVMERYTDKDNAFLKVHRNSAAFLEFRPKLKAMQEAGYVTIQGESFLDSGIGFGDRVVK